MEIPKNEKSIDFPVRCFSCGAVIGHLYEEYLKNIKTKSPAEALDELGVKRYCCRRMFISHKSVIGEITKYYGAVG